MKGKSLKVGRSVVVAALSSVFCVSGCGTGRTLKMESEMDREAPAIRKFQREYRRYHVESGDVPAFPKKELAVGDGASLVCAAPDGSRGVLKLELGERVTVGEPERFRTKSRYRLRSASGGVLGEAESVFSVGDLEEDFHDQMTIDVFLDPVTGRVLIYEQHDWTVSRLVVFGEGGVLYIWLPSRPSGNPTQRSVPLGIYDGKVYFRTDGESYAIPVGKFREDGDLSFTIG